jgi:hypothetical protein
MVFRSRRRAEMSQAVADGTERLEALIREQREALERLQETMLDSVAVTRREMELREGDLVEVLELVSELCRHAIDVVEADREEHREFLASFAEVVRPMIEASASSSGLAVGAPSETVFGGTVFAAPPDVDLVDVDLVEIEAHVGEDEHGELDAAAPNDEAAVKVQLPFR